MKQPSNPSSKWLVSPVLSYLFATVVTIVCWIGWRFDIFPYGGDLAFYGPLARLAGFLAWPFVAGMSRMPPSNPVLTALLTWSTWVVGLRVCTAVWNAIVEKSQRTVDKE